MVALVLVLGGACVRGAESSPCDCRRQATPVGVAFGLHEAAREPLEGTRAMPVRNADESVFVSPRAAFGLADLERAHVVPDGHGGRMLGLVFTADAAERLASFTAARIGRPLAVVLDGEVLQAARIQEPLGRSIYIVGNMTVAEMCRVACAADKGSAGT